jgi:uncharacterized integral membrane protein
MMKMKIPVGIVILMAVALGYLLGTESGRVRREALMVKLGRGDGEIIAGASDADSTDVNA